MSRKVKGWLIAAASLILVGGLVFTGGMTVLKWDFMKLSTIKYERNEHLVEESFRNITIVTDSDDVVFVPCDSENGSVVCFDSQKMTHAVSVENDTLTVKIVDTRKWYQYIGIHFGTPKLTVYLPQGEYGDLSIRGNTGDVQIPSDFRFGSMDVVQSTGDVTIGASVSDGLTVKTSTGDVRMNNVSANAIDVAVSTGKVEITDVACEDDVKIRVSTGRTTLTNVTCAAVISEGTTGKLIMNNVIAAETFSLKRNTGDVKFNGCDASAIYVTTSTGHVEGRLLSDKVFITDTSTGSVDVPKTITGGRCEIKTDTGDIAITVG